jgi:hypothetical protein
LHFIQDLKHYELEIKPDRAVKFLSKVLTVADESENALKTAEELLKLRTRERVENVEKKIQQLHMKTDKPLLSDRGVAKGGCGGAAPPPQCRVRRHNKSVVGKINWIKPIGNT